MLYPSELRSPSPCLTQYEPKQWLELNPGFAKSRDKLQNNISAEIEFCTGTKGPCTLVQRNMREPLDTTN